MWCLIVSIPDLCPLFYFFILVIFMKLDKVVTIYSKRNYLSNDILQIFCSFEENYT